MPINNKAIDRLFKKIRSKTGSVLLPATKMRTAMLPWRDKQYLLALVADQNPGVPSKGYWLNFFGRPTPFVTGPEKGARANDASVIFIHFTKLRRGYYQAHPELAALEPNSLPEKELTKRYIQYLERVIRKCGYGVTDDGNTNGNRSTERSLHKKQSQLCDCFHFSSLV
jgi:KDO2-lipid IV(A) lauroyltransferase